MDSVYGLEGNDLIYGGAGNDLLLGENGNDRLSGGNDDDRLNEGAGDDLFLHDDGNDTLYGGTEYSATAVNFVNGRAGNDRIIASTADELTGGAGTDIFEFTDFTAKLRPAFVPV